MKSETERRFGETKDELLMRAAVMAYLDREKETLRDEILRARQDADLQPSPESVQRIRRAYRRFRLKRFLCAMAKKVVLAVACLFLIGAILFTVCYVTIDAFRTQVSDFFSRRTAAYMEVSVSALSLPDTWNGYPVPLYVPEGYFIESEFVTEKNGGQIKYSNGMSLLVYSFYPIELKSNMRVDSENATHKNIKTEERILDLYKKNDTISVVFRDINFVYFIRGNISEYEIVEMQESIALKDEDK